MEADNMREITESHSLRKAATIRDVSVELLFGDRNYDLENRDILGEPQQLIVLYGDNGSGKSTILKLIFHLLNPEPYSGHRSFVGSIPFKHVRVTLTNGFSVTASRTDPFNLNEYQIQTNDPRLTEPLLWAWEKESRTSVDETYLKFCDALNFQGINLHFLQDTRRMEKIQNRNLVRRNELIHNHYLGGIEYEHEPQDPDSILSTTVEATLQWFQQAALEGTNEGQSSVNTIYANLVETLIRPQSATSDHAVNAVTNISHSISQLIELERNNNKFARFGLTPSLETESIRRHLESAPPEKSDILHSVLQPYIEGHTARLEALQDVQKIVEIFVDLLTDFYTDKTVKLLVGKKFLITANSGHEVSLKYLSSGERQLLLLFCNAILARAHNTILIIDEPEISLNIKWQRRLINALKSCMNGVQCQLIIATHSFEILAGNDESVRTLTHKPDGQDFNLQ